MAGWWTSTQNLCAVIMKISENEILEANEVIEEKAKEKVTSSEILGTDEVGSLFCHAEHFHPVHPTEGATQVTSNTDLNRQASLK